MQIKNRIQAIYNLFYGLFWRLLGEKVVPAKPSTPRKHRHRVGIFGEFTTIKNALKEIEWVFQDIKSISHHAGINCDSTLLAMIRKAGPFLLGKVDEDTESDMDRRLLPFDGTLPSFFLTAFPMDHAVRALGIEGIDDDGDIYLLKNTSWCNMMCLNLLSRSPPNVEVAPTGWVVYELARGFPQPRHTHKIDWDMGYFAVDPKTYAIKTLHLMVNIVERIQRKRRRKYEPSMIEYSHGGWRLPPMVKKALKDGETPREYWRRAFCRTFNEAILREAHWNVKVTKDDRSLTFAISDNDAPYFFKDRFDVKTDAGKRRPVFHAVKSHHRTLQSGRVTTVKTHYRGSDHFVWNGCSVRIYVPGRSGKLLLNELSFAGELVNETATPKKGMVPFEEGYDMLKENLEWEEA